MTTSRGRPQTTLWHVLTQWLSLRGVRHNHCLKDNHLNDDLFLPGGCPNRFLLPQSTQRFRKDRKVNYLYYKPLRSLRFYLCEPCGKYFRLFGHSHPSECNPILTITVPETLFRIASQTFKGVAITVRRELCAFPNLWARTVLLLLRFTPGGAVLSHFVHWQRFVSGPLT